MTKLIFKFGQNFCSVLYPVIFTFNFYVVTFTHMKNIGNDKTYLIVFFFANVLAVYIIAVYVKLWHDSGKNRIHRKYRNLEILIEGRIDEYVNQAFIEQNLALKDKKIQICDTCNVYKPPRSHHCSICNSCYLKMDHHCILLNICIGYRNYKTFYLFLVSNAIYFIGETIIFLIELFFVNKTKLNCTFYIIGIIFGTTVGLFCSIMTIFHTIFILRNETSIEWQVLEAFLNESNFDHLNVFQEGPLAEKKLTKIRDRKKLNPYFLGYYQNFIEVFGDKWFLWPLPYHTGISNGFNFNKNCN